MEVKELVELFLLQLKSEGVDVEDPYYCTSIEGALLRFVNWIKERENLSGDRNMLKQEHHHRKAE